MPGALSLFSAFAFGYSQRLLPIVLPLLHQLKRLTQVEGPTRRNETASAKAQKANAGPIECQSHPYKRRANKDKKNFEKNAIKRAYRAGEKHE